MGSDIASVLRDAAARLAASAVAEPRREAEALLARALGRARVDLLAHPEAAVDAEVAARFESDMARRAAGEPFQYIAGAREFFGREFEVGPGVLIPRPETELLVERALALLPAEARVCDVGAGSGAIAVTLAAERPDLRVAAVDISPAALEYARRNARRHEARVEFWRGDLLAAALGGAFDAVVSNPPYVAERARPGLQRELAWEPELALFAGEDGLAVYRRLIPGAARALRPGGALLLELGHDSAPAVAAMLADGPWGAPALHRDLAGIERVAEARLARAETQS